MQYAPKKKKKKKKKKKMLVILCLGMTNVSGLGFNSEFLSLAMCYFVLVFFCPFSIAISSLEEERANLSAFRRFVRFALVWFCLFPLPLGFIRA